MNEIYVVKENIFKMSFRTGQMKKVLDEGEHVERIGLVINTKKTPRARFRKKNGEELTLTLRWVRPLSEYLPEDVLDKDYKAES